MTSSLILPTMSYICQFSCTVYIYLAAIPSQDKNDLVIQANFPPLASMQSESHTHLAPGGSTAIKLVFVMKSIISLMSASLILQSMGCRDLVLFSPDTPCPVPCYTLTTLWTPWTHFYFCSMSTFFFLRWSLCISFSLC